MTLFPRHFLTLLIAACTTQFQANLFAQVGESVPARTFKSGTVTLHTDLPGDDVKLMPKRIEGAIKEMTKLFGKPQQHPYEIYMIHDTKNFPSGSIPPNVLSRLTAEFGSASLVENTDRSVRSPQKMQVFVIDYPESAIHSVAHAYLLANYQGRNLPGWFIEGLSEYIRFGADATAGVNCSNEVLESLKKAENRIPIDKLTADQHQPQHKVDDLAQCWALYYFLASNPNNQSKLKTIAQDRLGGNATLNFMGVFSANLKEFNFEFNMFLEQIEKGYRADLCSFDFKTKTFELKPEGITTRVEAGKGWQHGKITVEPNKAYRFKALDTWKITKGKDAAALTFKGDSTGKGRLIGTVFYDENDAYHLSEPFDFTEGGTFTPNAKGTLYLRCFEPWTEIGDNSGAITLKITPPE